MNRARVLPVFEAVDDRVPMSPGDHVRRMFRYRTFLGYWVLRNVLTRYRETTMGPLWAILQPLLSSLVYAFVFSQLLRVSTSPVPYPLFVITNLVLWTYSTRVIMSSPAALLGNLDLITRVQFPREFLVIGAWLEALTDLVFGLVVLGAFFVYYGAPLSASALLALGVFAVHTALALGVAFLASAASIVIRDLVYILPILLQLLLYLTPIVYPLEVVPLSLRGLYLLNPVVVVFAAYQETLLFGRFTLHGPLALSAVTSTVVLLVGYAVFKRLEWRLADVL